MTRIRLSRLLPVVGVGLLGALAVLAPFHLAPFRLLQLSFVVGYAIAVLGLNLVTGYTGQISLAQGAFFGIGAYTVAILVANHGWPYLLALPVAALLSFVIGVLFGLPALRIRGLSLGLVTVALAVSLRPLLEKFSNITGGKTGVFVPKPKAPAWTHLDDRRYLYFLALAIAVGLFAAAKGIVSGRMGRAMIATRDTELVAEAMGIRTAAVKTLAFGMAAFYAGAGGGLYALMVGVVTSDSFPLLLSVGFLAAVVVGGEATVVGAVFGALFIEFMPYYASSINPGLAPMIYGASLITFMLLTSGGVMSAGHWGMEQLRSRERARARRNGSLSIDSARPPRWQSSARTLARPGSSRRLMQHQTTAARRAGSRGNPQWNQ